MYWKGRALHDALWLVDGCCAAAGLLQDSTGMKMWKKRWFVLCDMCLFYYRGESSEFVYKLIFEEELMPKRQNCKF